MTPGETPRPPSILARAVGTVWLKWLVGALLLGLLGFAAVKLLPLLPADNQRGEWETPAAPVVLGVIFGLTYGLLAVGLVLVYRTNRFINFAHGEMGAFGASLFGLAVVSWGVPYWIAFPLALLAAGGVGAIVETGVIRRLRRAPRLMSVVATLGVGQFLVTFALAINTEAGAGAIYPEPPGLPEFNVGPLFVTRAHSAMLFLSPLIVIALVLFLRRSRFGLAILGSAANPDAARMAGIFSSRMSTLAWGVAGALAAFTAIFLQPLLGFSGAGFFGPSLLLRALAGAVVARMNNLGVALVAGVGIGVIEQLILWNYSQGGMVNAVLFGLILIALLAQRTTSGREEEKGSWAAVQALRPIPDAFKQMWIARNLSRVVAFIGLGVAAALPLLVSHSTAITLTSIVGFSIVGLSVGLITGLGGQLSLGQFALAAIGSVASIVVAERTGNFALAFLYAGVAGAAASLVIGIPALRIKGLMLTVTTLALSFVAPSWLLFQPWMLGDGRTVPAIQFFGYELDTGIKYYIFALVVLSAVLWVARNVWRGGIGRLLRAIRDNEDNARAFTIPATASKTKTFLLSGFIAGIGGALYAHSLSSVTAGSFPPRVSIDVVTMTVVGGVSLLPGPLLGVLFVVGLPKFVPLDSFQLATTQAGILFLILYLPGGLGSVIEPLRDRVLGWFARRKGITVEKAGPDDEDAALTGSVGMGRSGLQPLLPATRVVAGELLLDARDLRKSFGGVKAVNGVSLRAYSGETLGIIGPNGAGKTTTFELLAGFTRLDDGTVAFDGRDVTWMTPEQRGRLGLIRSFQDAALFPTMTVLEVIQLAMERVAPTRVVSSALGFQGIEKRKEKRAREVVSFMGLDAYRDKQIRELSTGTRRITELACMLTLEPSLLLLDEPSSGIAQRETEQLGRVLSELKDQFGMTLVVIEHDIPLIMGLSDRIVAMADGKVIAEGPPAVVRDDPQVVESYLGGSLQAIERSGAIARTDTSDRATASEPTVVEAT